MLNKRNLQVVIDAKDNASSVIRGVGSIAGSTAKSVGVALGIITTGSIALATKSIAAFQKQELVETKLAQLMRQTSQATDEQIKSVKDYASEIQKLGVVGDEVIMSGEAQLSTFALNSEQIKKLIPLVVDLATNEKGLNVTQEDMFTKANAVGRALEGGAGALTRFGISLTDAQKKSLEAADKMERVDIVAEILADNVGGVNEALRKTSGGSMTAFKNTWGDIIETVGSRAVPAVSRITDYLNENSDAVQAVTLALADIGVDVFNKLADSILNNKDEILVFLKEDIPQAMQTIKSTTEALGWVFDKAAQGIFNIIDGFSVMGIVLGNAFTDPLSINQKISEYQPKSELFKLGAGPRATTAPTINITIKDNNISSRSDEETARIVADHLSKNMKLSSNWGF